MKPEKLYRKLTASPATTARGGEVHKDAAFFHRAQKHANKLSLLLLHVEFVLILHRYRYVHCTGRAAVR